MSADTDAPADSAPRAWSDPGLYVRMQERAQRRASEAMASAIDHDWTATSTAHAMTAADTPRSRARRLGSARLLAGMLACAATGSALVAAAIHRDSTVGLPTRGGAAQGAPAPTPSCLAAPVVFANQPPCRHNP